MPVDLGTRLGAYFSPCLQLPHVPAVPSSQQHRHTTSEKPPKGKKNRNRKVGQITVSEKWRESVFRKITNANELKFLDEFLLNKVSGCCPSAAHSAVPRLLTRRPKGLGPAPASGLNNTEDSRGAYHRRLSLALRPGLRSGQPQTCTVEGQ